MADTKKLPKHSTAKMFCKYCKYTNLDISASTAKRLAKKQYLHYLASFLLAYPQFHDKIIPVVREVQIF